MYQILSVMSRYFYFSKVYGRNARLHAEYIYNTCPESTLWKPVKTAIIQITKAKQKTSDSSRKEIELTFSVPEDAAVMCSYIAGMKVAV